MKKIIVLILLLTQGAATVFGQAFLNKAVIDGRVDSAWAGYDLPQGYTGNGVIIGFTDWGFDYTHPVFYDTNMIHYRVLKAWDQFRNAGPAPDGYDYGTEFVGPEQLLTAACDTANFYDYGYHGTHVASIAGGAGAGTKYRGVAFEADLMFATIRMTEQAVIDAWNWMYQTAVAAGKRLIISMSWGLYFMDNMDGTGVLATEMQRLNDLGVIFVVSAGNNGDVNFHLEHEFADSGDTIRTQVTFPYDNGNMWGTSVTMMNSADTPFDFALHVMDHNGGSLTTTDFISTSGGDNYVDTFLTVGTDTMVYNYQIRQNNPYDNRPVVRLRIKLNNTYKFGLFVTSGGGDFHAWNVAELYKAYGNWGADFRTPPQHPDWISGDNLYGISTPGNVDCAITVAAHSPRFVNNANYTIGGAIADFSSSGPGFGTSIKPEVSAPGKGIAAAISSYTNTYHGNFLKTVNFNGRSYHFAYLSGTSMSAPFVSGVVALVLQANPYLSATQVKDIITESAYEDSFTAAAGINRFGYGKVHAYQAILSALTQLGIETPQATEEPLYTLYPNPTNGTCYLTAQTDNKHIFCQIFDITGRMVGQQHLQPGVNHLDIHNLPPGCYVLRINDNHKISTQKLIKQ